MDLYQLSDLMNGMNSNIAEGQAIFLTVLSAYLVVAYTVGARLTRYQVTFVSILFLIMALLGVFSQLRNIQMMSEWGAQVVVLSGKEAVPAAQGEVAKWLFIGMRISLTMGALVFMWQVRHPKAE
jgi:hypothetical protein